MLNRELREPRDLSTGIQQHQRLPTSDGCADPAARPGDRVERLLPVTEPAYCIGLALIKSSPMHGYGMMKEVNGWPGRSTGLGPGTLNRTLAAMISNGLVEETHSPMPESQRNQRGQRYYRITELGKEVCVADHARREHLLDHTRAILGKEKRWT